MDQPFPDDRLSHISTLWANVFAAHQQPADSASPQSAQEALLQRYSGAIKRYLLGALGDQDAADEAYQEFCLRLVRGDLRAAHPDRGRFRDYVRTILIRLVVDYRRQRQSQIQPLSPDVMQAVVAAPDEVAVEAELLAYRREELLARTWQALQALENSTGQPCYAVLRFRTLHPLLTAAEMAEQLSIRLGKTLNDVSARKALQRARDKFADLLLHQVAQSVQDQSAEGLVEELRDLGLLCYCQAALTRYRRPAV